MKKNGITAGGTWIADYTKIVAGFPDEGACTSTLAESINTGGAAYNILANICRLDASIPLRAIGCIGKDVDGESILKDCASHGIDSSRLRVVSEAQTSYSDIMVSEDTGVRTCFNYAGANAFLEPADFDFREDNSRIFFLGTLFFVAALDQRDPLHGTKAAAVLSLARKRGMLTCIDIERVGLASSVFESGGRAALHETDLAILNVEIAERLTGRCIRYPAGVEVSAAVEAASKLLAIGNGKCAVIRFPTGAVAVSDNGETAIQGSVRVPKSRIVSAAGTGHAFTAGFLQQYHHNLSLDACLRAGHAAAACCLIDRSPSGGVKKLSSCLSLLETFGQREIVLPGTKESRQSAA